MLMVRVLGPVEVVVDRSAREIVGAKERALLAILASQVDRHVSVEKLIDELWTQRTPASAAAGVHTFVSRLRRQLGPLGSERLGSQNGGYTLSLAHDELDELVFLRCAADGRAFLSAGDPARAAERLRDGLAIWRGRPFEGVSTATTDAEAARLSEARTGAFEMLVEADLAAGRHVEVIAELDQLIRDHPFHERFWAMRMLALYRCGRQAEALRSYQELRTLVLDQLGFEPTPELQRLELAMLEHDPGLEWSAGSTRSDRSTVGLATRLPPGHSVDLGPIAPQPRLEAAALRPLVGREIEREALAAVRTLRGPRRLRAAVVTGVPGAGKTRLVVDAALDASAAGSTVLIGSCYEDSLGSFQPVAEIVRWLFEQVPSERLALALPDVTLSQLRRLAYPSDSYGDATPSRDPSQVELFEAVATLLRLVAAARQVVVVLEDIHWIDPPTAALLRYVVRRLEGDPVVVICTHRSNDVSDQHVMHELIATLRRATSVHDISLGMLDPGDVSKLACSIVGPVSREVAQALHDETAGNPLFVVELLRHMIDTGELGSAARFDDPEVVRATAPPESIRELVAQRIERLGASAAEVLSTGAVLGREFDSGTVALTLGVETAVVGRALDRAREAGLVDLYVDVPGRYAFSHALIRRTLYDGIPAGERAIMHRTIAETLESHSLGTASQLALHYYESAAGAPTDKAVATGLRAAKEAQGALAFEDSVQILERTLRLAETRGTPRDRIELLLTLGDARWWAGDVEGSQDVCRQALELTRSYRDDELFARAVLGRWRNNGAATQDFSVAAPDNDMIDLLEEALAGLTEHPALRAALLGRLAIANYWTAPFERRRELADSAVALARVAEDDNVLLDVLVDRQLGLWMPGAEEQRLKRSQEILALAKRLGQPAREADARIFEFVDHLILGDIRAADASLRRYFRAAAMLRQPFYRWHAHFLPALRALMDGRFEESESLTATATDEGDYVGPSADSSGALAGLQTLWLCYERGILHEIAPLIDAVADSFGEAPALDAARTWLAAETGDPVRAAMGLGQLLEHDFDIAQSDFSWLAAMCLLASAAATIGDEPAARRLREILTPYSGRNALAWVGLCCGPVDHYLGMLSATLGDLPMAAASYDAAARLASGMNATPLLLRINLDSCRLSLRLHEPDLDSIRRTLGRVAADADRLGMVRVSADAQQLLDDIESDLADRSGQCGKHPDLRPPSSDPEISRKTPREVEGGYGDRLPP